MDSNSTHRRMNIMKSVATSVCILAALIGFTTVQAGSQDKSTGALFLPKQVLLYKTPATVWDEAFPLGNGLLGALVWGDGGPLKISLDRTDLWDLRPVMEFQTPEYSYKLMRQWVKEGRLDDLHRLYEKPYETCAGPTRIPAGRIELDFGGEIQFDQARLNLADATATVTFTQNTKAEIFVHAQKPVGMIRISGLKQFKPHLCIPPFSEKPSAVVPEDFFKLELNRLGYPKADILQGQNWIGYTQQGWGNFRYAVAISWKSTPQGWLAAWSIITNAKTADPVLTARRECDSALNAGYDKMFAEHREWWDRFWMQSSIHIPNTVLERQWYLDMYKFGSAARPDTPPISLQGPWTADTDKIPPWRGDYHHDLNTELSYWPAYSGNHLEGETGYVNWLWNTRQNAQSWTERFFQLPGLNVPMTADLNQNQMGGWHQYTHSSTTGAWLGHHFYLHWRYTRDKNFLKNRAYPWIRETAVFLEAVTESTSGLKRTLPLSSSPEYHDNKLEAWFPSITNYDLALIRFTFSKAAELAEELGLSQEAKHWQARLVEMPDFAVDPATGKLFLAEGFPLDESHRHMSHLLAIYPLGLIRWENGPNDQNIIAASLADLDRLGTSHWTGYSFAWRAILAARACNGDDAEKYLDIFANAFCLRNSFHCNGDQSGKNYSIFTYRPFTLEGNFAAATALQEMLVQSDGEIIRIFPAIPHSWADVEFDTLRTDGAMLISAVRKNNQVEKVEITPLAGGLCRLKNPFAQSEFAITGTNKENIRIEEDTILIQTRKNQKILLQRKSL
jgi:alpha-L-fucosidase 2